MLPGSWTEERRRPAFPPAPAIPTYIHLQSANERGSIIEPQSLRQPPGIDDQSTSSIHPGDSSSSPDRDPYLNELSREVQYSPSLPEHIPTNRADANFLRFVQEHPPLQSTPADTPRNLSHNSLPYAFSHLLAHEASDGGLATSTQRLAINKGYSAPRHSTYHNGNIFSPRSPPINLPNLDTFLRNLKPPSFTPWTDILSPEELTEYQTANHRKFPILHRLRTGISIWDLKANKVRKEFIPGFENDCWRFVVDVCVLLAGSPYARFLDLNLFYWYTESIVSVVSRHLPFPIERDVSNFIGGGSLALVTSFLICILLVYQCWKMLQIEDLNRHVQQTGFEGTLLVCHSRKDKTGRLLTMFFLTILYIPISKFAVDSLIWKDSLFFAGTCYTTIGFNWVYFILPAASLVVICYTFYFPFLLKRIIERNHPTLDKYNEAGELRTQVDEEYNRLMNCDESPYNFLYNVTPL